MKLEKKIFINFICLVLLLPPVPLMASTERSGNIQKNGSCFDSIEILGLASKNGTIQLSDGRMVNTSELPYFNSIEEMDDFYFSILQEEDIQPKEIGYRSTDRTVLLDSQRVELASTLKLYLNYRTSLDGNRECITYHHAYTQSEGVVGGISREQSFCDSYVTDGKIPEQMHQACFLLQPIFPEPRLYSGKM